MTTMEELSALFCSAFMGEKDDPALLDQRVEYVYNVGEGACREQAESKLNCLDR